MNRRAALKRLWVSTVIFVPRLIRAQSILTAEGLAAFRKPVASGGGGGGASYSLLTHAGAAATGNTSTTTPGVDTTGANLIVLVLPWGSAAGGLPSYTDSKSNTWTLSTAYIDGNPKVTFAYCISPIVGTGHTFTANPQGGSGFGIHAYILKKSSGTPAFDASAAAAATGNWGNLGKLHPGSVTPATSADVFITAVVWDVPSVTTSASADSGFTSPEPTEIGACFYGMASAYKIKTDALAENPGWTPSPTTNNDAQAVMIAFK